MPISQRTVQICLFLLAAIGLFGGTLQMSLGQPDTTPRLDNVYASLPASISAAGSSDSAPTESSRWRSSPCRSRRRCGSAMWRRYSCCRWSAR